MGAPLNARQLKAVQVSERAMSTFSVLGSLLIITTFLQWPYFRRPINRLIFYASFGNLLANIATLISTATLSPAGSHFSSLCEFQGILIQWFMMADSLWVFCMALNVMLVFFHNYDSRQLRHLEKWYLLFAYGTPGITAIIYLILDHVGPKKIIGPATIWCWVSSEVEWMRLAFFYVPVWIILFATWAIYAVTGAKIWKKRAELRSFSKRTSDMEADNTLANPFTAGKTNEIKVKTEMTVETHTTLGPNSDRASSICGNESRSSFASTKNLSSLVEAPDSNDMRFSHSNSQKSDGDTTHHYKATAFSNASINASTSRHRPAVSVSISGYNPNRGRNAANAAAWSYFKVAFLMFTALFIVWVPSSANRVQQFVHKDRSIFGLNLASALVLPLQGFWNAMIYISTTWPECKRAFAETWTAVFGCRVKRKPRSHGRDIHTSIAAETHEFGPCISLDNITRVVPSELVRNLRPEAKRNGIHCPDR